MTFLSYLHKPASFNTRPWVIVLMASLLVCFLLGFFQPFGIDTFSVHTKYFVVIGYTVITATSTSIVGYLLPFLFRKFYNPLKWTIGKSLINNFLIIVCIALGNAIFNWSIGHHLTETFGSVLLSYILVTSLIGFIPALVSVFIVQNHALKRNLNEAKLLNRSLKERLKNTLLPLDKETETIVLSGNTKETVTLYPDNILYLESSANYIKVNYLSNGVVKQKQLRNTISQIAADLQSFPYLVRCHRAYIVNISYITYINGNSQGLQLSLQFLKEEIPVSRSYFKEFKDKL